MNSCRFSDLLVKEEKTPPGRGFSETAFSTVFVPMAD